MYGNDSVLTLDITEPISLEITRNPVGNCTHLAADTIFMDWVIFWMFLTDLRRKEMVFRVAMLRCCWLVTAATWVHTPGIRPNILLVLERKYENQ